MILPILSVKDIELSIAFYEKLGFVKTVTMLGSDEKLAMAFVQFDGHDIGLSRASDIPATPYIDFMISVPKGTEVDAHYEQVKARGVAIAEDLKTQYWGDRSFTVIDPDGYRIILFQTVEKMNVEKVEAVMRGDLKAE